MDAIATDIEAVFSGAGDDTIDALNGRLDEIDCGPGRDEVFIDTIDRLQHCESSVHGDPEWVFRNPVLPPPPSNPAPPSAPVPTADAPSPTLKLTLPARTRRQALTRGFAFTAACSQACRLTARLATAAGRRSRAVRPAERAGATALHGGGQARARGTARVRATLVVRAVDRRGRAVTVQRTVTLR